jgi:invasion protein IalB
MRHRRACLHIEYRAPEGKMARGSGAGNGMHWIGRLVAICTFAVAALPAAAGDDVPTLWVYQDWQLGCLPTTQTNTSCELRQDVVELPSRRHVARLNILRLKGVVTLEVIMPYNLLLEPGIGLGFGDEQAPRVFDYDVCLDGGCIARFPLDVATIGKLTTGKMHRILFAGLDGQPVGMPFSTAGLAAAFKAFQQQEAGRKDDAATDGALSGVPHDLELPAGRPSVSPTPGDDGTKTPKIAHKGRKQH